MKKRKINRYIFIFIALFVLVCPSLNFKDCSLALDYNTSYAQNENTEDDLDQTLDETSQAIEEEIGKQLDNLDFSSLDDILLSLTDSQTDVFGGSSFIDKLQKLLNGEFDNNQSLWTGILSIFFDNLLSILPTMSLIIAIALLGSMLQGLKPNNNGKSISSLIHFVTYGIIVVLLLSIVVKMISLTTTTLQSVKSQMDAIFPILLTLLTAIGGTVSTSVYQPAMALLAGTIMNLFTYVLLPIFIFSIVFNIISNLSTTVNLDKFTSFFDSTFKWITGLIFTIFTAFLSIQGITAGSIDGISLRTAKFAIRSYIPILGSYISDGMGIILASSNLIKNAVGATGLFLLLATIISPLIELVLFMLILKLVAGIIEPLGNKQIANFIASLSKSMQLLIALIVGIAFIYFITMGLVMCSANII